MTATETGPAAEAPPGEAPETPGTDAPGPPSSAATTVGTPAAQTVYQLSPVPTAELAARTPCTSRDPAHQLLQALVGGRLPNLLRESTPSGARSRQAWLCLTEAELGQLRSVTEGEARRTGDNPRTLAIRGLDRLIGAPVSPPRGAQRTCTPQPGAYQTPEEKAARAEQYPAVKPGQVWFSHATNKPYRIALVDGSVWVAGVGEFPLQRFHQTFYGGTDVAVDAAP